MTEAEAGIRARHWRVGGRGTVYPEQCVCGLAWPCDAAFLLAEVERLRGMVDALEQEKLAWREVQRVLRDQSVIVAEDGVVFEQIAKWAKVPSNTASAALEAGDG